MAEKELEVKVRLQRQGKSFLENIAGSLLRFERIQLRFQNKSLTPAR
jgi:hypothetical protein